MSAFTYARIELIDKDAVDPERGIYEKFDVQFNPTQYALTKGAQLAEIGIPGIDSPILQFVRGQTEKLTLELFFDTTHHGMGGEGREVDVRTYTQSIYQLVKIQPKTHAPPRIRFIWGSLSFKAVVENVQQTFTLFSSSGLPLRATVSVSFREYKTLEEQLKELKLESSDHTREYVVRRGDTLSRIAGQQYGDAERWREIALHPDNVELVSDPARPPVGARLRIPPLQAGRSYAEEVA